MTPSELIDERIKEIEPWKGEMFAELRKIINSSDQDIKEEWKWDTAVWTKNGMVCAIGAFKDHIKINFFKGAKLEDKHKLINAGLDSKNHRSIDFFEGDKINGAALKDLIKEAIELNSK